MRGRLQDLNTAGTPASAGMTAAQYLDIAVSSPLRRTFHYLPETDRSCADYPLGVRVRVRAQA